MNRFVSFLKNNRATVAMLLFILVFYLAIVAGESAVRKTPVKNLTPTPAFSQKTQAPQASQADEFKQKEELFEKNVTKRPGLMVVISLSFIAALAAGLFLDARWFWKAQHGKSWLAGGYPHEPVAWDWTHVLQAAVFMFFAESVFLILETVYCLVFGIKEIPKDFLLMANSLLRDTVAALFIILMVRRMGHKLSALGLTARDFFKNMLRGVAGYIAVLPALFLTLIIISAATKIISYEPPPQNVVQIYLKKSSDPYLLFFTIFVAGAGPLIEEIFFRGFAYNAFRQKFGVVPGMLVTSAIFAAFHLNLVAFLPIFVLGMMLCYLYEETGSLVPSMTAHMLHNLLMINFTLGFKSIVGS